MFHGRKFELSELQNLYLKNGFKFIVVYGRRRVGKTALIVEFIRDKDNIFYISTERNDKAALDSFSEKVFERFPAPAFMPNSFASWDNAFEYIADQVGNNRIVVVIDEYPYLVSGNPSISSILQKFIDTRYKQTNLFLILCGSSMNFMQNQVLGYTSPLYGRRSAQFHIKPFDYYDSGLFFPEMSPADKMLAYAVCGGVPQYLGAVAEYGDIAEGIIECFLRKSGILYEEPENLLKQELREPSVYNSLITSIANGAGKLNEISTKSGEESKKCSKYLKSLLDLHIVRKELPYGNDTQRNGIYVLADNMFKFWYRFIPQNIVGIESGLGRRVYEERIMPNLSEYMGYIFEGACIEYMLRKNGTSCIPFMFDGIGRWWGANPYTKTQAEIDIVASSNEQAIFCECKWTNETIGMDALEKLQGKSLIFGRYPKKYYIVFSKAGFTEPILMYAQNNNKYNENKKNNDNKDSNYNLKNNEKNYIKLVSLDMLYHRK